MMSRMFALITLAALAQGSLADDWPAFRGPSNDGIAPSSAEPPRTWSATENVVWKAPLPSPGNGSPIVVGTRVLVTCAEDQGKKRSLYCFSRKDGKRLWVKTVTYDQVMPTHKTNPYGGTTPAASEGRVVVWHGSAGLFCYDLDGKELWSRDLGGFRHIWGYGTSPIIHDGKVILHAGPGEQVFMTALDLMTGKTVWKTDEPVEGNGSRNNDGKYTGSWSTPVVAEADGKTVIICNMSTRVNAYDPDTGAIVWSCDGMRGRRGDLAYTSTVLAGDVCVAMGGFSGPAYAFRMGGTGDITESNRLWREESNPQRIGSGVTVEGHVYMANAGPGVIQCLDPKTGKELWKERGGANYWGSLVHVNGLIYGTDQNGTTIVFRPDPRKLDVLARNPLDEASNATPAFSGKQVFIRTDRHLWALGG